MIELRSVTPAGEFELDENRVGHQSVSDEEGHLISDAPNDEVDTSRSWRRAIPCTTCSSRSSITLHAAFWLLGLCNNFGYVVFLTAAHDILEGEEQGGNSTSNGSSTLSNSSNTSCDQLECTKAGTGTILLADILPTLIIKLTAPYYMHLIPYWIRVLVCILTAVASFVIVALAHTPFLIYSGVVFASIGAGLGEITFLSLTSHYPLTSVSYWSSGTGAAGLVGAGTYALLRLGLSSRNTLLVCNLIPLLMAASYWVVLPKPDSVTLLSYDATLSGNDGGVSPHNPNDRPVRGKHSPPGSSAKMTLRTKFFLLKPLLRYMAPLFFVYYAEYLINQGLFELMIWRQCISISPKTQYRWFQTTYQFGVFMSRSSVQIFPIKRLWLLAVLQVANIGILFSDAYAHAFPSIAISFVIIAYEGLLGGACYVNAFSQIRKDVDPKHCEFSLGAASVADTFGIALAGASAIPFHNSVCSALNAG